MAFFNRFGSSALYPGVGWLIDLDVRKFEMKNCRWLKPELLAQIEFTEWTPDGHLRHSKFVGLREDKAAREVVREG